MSTGGGFTAADGTENCEFCITVEALLEYWSSPLKALA